MLLLTVMVLLLVRWCSNDDPTHGMQIENTPMRVEQIRAIAHLATISFEDEVVVDSVEYYKNGNEQLSGNLSKLLDPQDFKHGFRGSNVKRRLTLIISGKLRYGFNLKSPKFSIRETDTCFRVTLPNPEVLDVSTTPTSTRVFQENGEWSDHAINKLKKEARMKIISHFESLKLRSRACHQMELLIKPLLPGKKRVYFTYMQA